MEKQSTKPITRMFNGRFDEVAAVMPRFDRRPFSIGTSGTPSQANDLYDLIIRREQAEGGWIACPAGVVSKSYRLIEHREAAAVLADAFEHVGIDPLALVTRAILPRYGAAMSLEVDLPDDWRFDPGDGHPMRLQLRCQNSVDGTSPLRVALVWLRLVCANGLMVPAGREQRGFAHREATAIEDVVGFLSLGLEVARAERAIIAQWLHLPVEQAALPAFADTTLKDRWGAIDAARFLHIARTGCDAELADRFQPGKPSEKGMTATVAVPGSPARATSAWHVMQALSWVAKKRKDPADQLDRLQEIPGFMEGLATTSM